MTKSTRRPRATKTGVLVAALVLLFGTGVAVAYWTTPGTGAGTAQTATPATAAITVVQTSTVSDLAPGAAAATLAGTFDNDDESEATLHVTTVTASISGVTKAPNAPAGTCTAADYELTDAVMNVPQDLPYGESVGTWSGATIAFHSTNQNQDACKGATVTLAYTVS